MPVAVSDAGPLIHLSQVDRLDLLLSLFGTVLVTGSVKVEAFDEGIRLGCPDAEAIGRALNAGWLKIEQLPVRFAKSVAKLAGGENVSHADAEVLLLARAKKAKFLVDEKLLSDLAKMYGLQVWSTWTLLLESQSRKLISLADLEAVVGELGKKKFRLNAQQTAQILQAAEIIEKKNKRR